LPSLSIGAVTQKEQKPQWKQSSLATCRIRLLKSGLGMSFNGNNYFSANNVPKGVQIAGIFSKEHADHSAKANRCL
jgi:hypothetical protein